MAGLIDYTGLITSEHQDKPTFVATVSAVVQPLVDMQNLLLSFSQAFDIDTAVGVQLDVLGQWIGRSRNVAKPITGVYFEFDGDASLGWDSGIWQGPFDPTSGLVSLPDDSYRILLKTKIVANHWDGSIPLAYAIWASIFPDSQIIMQDNQDMTMTVAVVGSFLDALSLALLVQGYIPLKPEGVSITSFDVLPAPGLMFAWDIPDPPSAYDDGFDLDIPPQYLGGWDAAQWARELQPTT